MKLTHIAAALLVATAAFAQQPKPSPEAPQAAPPPKADPAPTTARPVERPLASLPYTPSLDVPSMDRSADPCTDFYQYTCGGWLKNNPIPSDQARWSVYGKLSQENEQYLWGILEQAADSSKERTAAQQKIGDYFSACMDDAEVERLAGQPLQPLLNEIAALESRKELGKFLAERHLRTTGSGWLFGFGAEQDFGDATQVIAWATAGGLSLPDRDYYLKDDERSKDIRTKYLAHVATMLQLLGETKAQAKAHALTVMGMERALAKASLTRVEQRDPYKLYHVMSRAAVQKLTPGFDWATYLSTSGVPSDLEKINVSEPKFFQQVQKSIANVPLSDWKTYLRWKAVHEAAPYLSSKFVNEDFNFYRKTLRGVTEMAPRWKRCVRYVDRDLGEALGQEFVRRTFSAGTKAKTVEMTERIERAMENEIKNLDWMSADTKKRALEKLHSVANKVGYPEKWRDYSSLQIKRGEFYANAARAVVFESQRDLAKIGKPVDRGEWGMTPPTVNAYYNPQMNDINFPAGVLQPPLYDAKIDDAPNYGNTGSTIGHELTHGFDDEGRQFDAQGNLKDWWTEQDAKNFEERIQCVRDQFAEFVIVDDIKINSKLTSGEDVADLGGTLLAYLAWKEATATANLVPDIDGFSPDQRFFIGFAQWACENSRPENERVSAITDPHSPGKYRINGIVSNLPEFAKAFRCGENTPMNRGARSCKVW
jgi:endothelin-converting enzyme/putative endopeptidase